MSERHRQTETPEELKIARVVKAVPEEEPSLAWRSALNELILDVAEKRKKRPNWRKAWLPATGLGTCGAIAVLAFALWMGEPATEGGSTDGMELEAAMVVAHKENIQFADIAGPGLSEADAAPSPKNGSNVQWKSEDLEAL